MPLIASEKDLLMAHLIRDDTTIQCAISMLDPEDFHEEGETQYAVLWEIIRDYYMTNRTPIPVDHLCTSLLTKIGEVEAGAGWIEQVVRLVESASGVSNDRIDAQAVVPRLLQPFVSERQRLLSSWWQDRAAQANASSTSSDGNQQIFEDDVDVCDVDDPRHWGGDYSPKPTGSLLFDRVFGGYRQDNTVGVLCPNGTMGLAVVNEVSQSLAKQGKHTFFISWDPARPTLGRTLESEISPFVHTIDLPPLFSEKGEVATAALCLKRRLHQLHCEPTLVAFSGYDHLAEFYMKMGERPAEARYQLYELALNEIKVLIKFLGVQAIVLHRLNNRVSRSPINATPDFYDAQGLGSFTNYMDAVMVFANADRNGRSIVVKSKRDQQKHLVKLDPHTQEFSLLDHRQWEARQCLDQHPPNAKELCWIRK